MRILLVYCQRVVGVLRRVIASLVRRRGDGEGPRRGPLVVLAVVCVVAVVAAVSGAVKPVSGLSLLQAGHWVANPALQAVFHINGAARSVDAKVDLPGLERGDQVVQGETHGYVVGRNRIVQFGKSDLSVERTLTPPPTGERPVALEAPGGPYLIYKAAGTVVRLGDGAATIRAGGTLGEPVVTPDGTLWLHRVQTGVLCRLPAGGTTIACPAHAEDGHRGALTVVGETPVFVDTTADTLRPLTGGKLGKPTPAGLDLPDDARIAPVDARQRVAVYDAGGRKLHLVDASALGTERAGGKAISVYLPHASFSGPNVSGSSIVMLDERDDTVRTYGPRGEPRGAGKVRGDGGEHRLSRGEDKRVYVDDPDGEHVLVVDPEGKVGTVPVPGEQGPGGPRSPRPPEPSRTQDPDPEPSSGSPTPGPPPRKPEPEPVPASPPGMPPSLKAGVVDGKVRVTWGAADSNGDAVKSYHLAWRGPGKDGATELSGSRRSYELDSLTGGRTYTITLRAENDEGRGTPAEDKVTAPPSVTVVRGDTETYNETCEAPDCAKMLVRMYGFPPDAEYDVEPFATDEYSNPGRGVTIDADGDESFQAFHYGDVGEYVWVVAKPADGGSGPTVTSKRYRWRSE